MKRTSDLPALLRRVEGDRRLVRITRDIPGADRVEGYVVGVGTTWVLLWVPDDRARADGYKLIRLRDVEAAWAWPSGERFLRRALKLQGEWPPSAPEVPIALDSTTSLLTSLSRHFPLLSIFDGYHDPDVCFIGRLTSRRGPRFELSQISPQARWDGIYRSRNKRFSRVDVGGGYEAALEAVAGRRPIRA